MKELIEIQHALKAPKGQYNSFGKYKYRSCEDILEAVKPLLHEQKCQLTLTDDVVLVGNRIYVKAVARLTNESGEEATTSAFAREEENKKGMDGSQITGTASSYARKYALNGLFCIDDTKDSDATNTHGKEKAVEVPDGIFDMAKGDVERCTSLDALQITWENYRQFQADKNFIRLVNKRKAEINNGTN